MKKSIIALAAASALASSAFAQSNVTVYGVADVGAAYSKDSGTGPVANTTSGITSSLMQQSFVGIKGSETLGNGLKAVFAVEQGFDTSGAGAVARNQFVGVESKYGTVKLGRLETTSSVYTKRFDAMGSSAFSSQNVFSSGVSEQFSNSTASYQGAAGKFGFGATYSSDGSTDVTGVTNKQAYGNGVTQEQTYSANASYANGGFAAGYVYTKGENIGRVTTVNSDADAHLIGASYDFGVAKIVGSYKTVDAKAVSGATDVDQYNIGAQVPVGAVTRVDVGYSRTELTSGIKGDTDSYAIQVTHNLSPRTAVYGGYKYVDGSVAVLGDASTQLIGAGIRHAF